MKQNYKSTINACFCAYIVQAIINNFAPLLFVKFQNEFSVPLSQITLLITFNFSVRLLVDLLSAKVLDKIGYRASMIAAHFLSSLGMVSLAVLPFVMIVAVGYDFGNRRRNFGGACQSYCRGLSV